MDIIQERVNDPKQQNIATTSASSYPHAQLQPSTSQSAGIVACNSQKRIINLEDDDSDSAPGSKQLRVEVLAQYPKDDPRAVPVQFSDAEYLKPYGMLNDTIIEFYLKVIQLEMVPLERRSSVFVFSPFFFASLTKTPGGITTRSVEARSKLVANNYKSVRKWTKQVNLFEMDYIVVPIFVDLHWSLAIITFPRLAITGYEFGKSSKLGMERLQKPHIIMLDSLEAEHVSDRKRATKVLLDYLECEYNDKKEEGSAVGRFEKDRMIEIVPRPVPQQRNYTDCGVFLLKYAECFLTKPPLFITQSDSFRRWYPNFTIRGMRRKILSKLKSLCDEQTWLAYQRFSNDFSLIADPLPVAQTAQSSRTERIATRHRSLSTGDIDYGTIKGTTTEQRASSLEP